MPTVVVLDVSLSMFRPVLGSSLPPNSTPCFEENVPTRGKLAVEAINQFLDHVSNHCKLEFVSFVCFSSTTYVITPFGRDLDLIRNRLENFNDDCQNDKTNFDLMLQSICALIVESWGTSVPIQILLITDGAPGFGFGSLRSTIKRCSRFPFPSKMNILSLSDPNDRCYTENCQLLQRLIDSTCGDGVVYFPENNLNSKGLCSAVSKLCVKDFTPYKGILTCGHLNSNITLCPPPQPYISRVDDKRHEISNKIEVLGFIDLGDLSNPPAHSRHLVLPMKIGDSHPNGNNGHKTMTKEDEEDIEGRTPNFCVLLHGALKVESYCALCEIGTDWYGFLYSWADSKKKSNLMLSVLSPGTDVVPWLGRMEEIGPELEFSNFLKSMRCSVGSSASTSTPSFPVRGEKKSYNATPTVWITSSGINADVQKLLRHSKKLPEKNQQFFKELNRMRRWALTLGFTEILESLAQILERECMMLTNAHPEATIQLTHAASQLRSNLPFSKMIIPHKAQ